MERMLNLRVSNEFMEALEEAKWTLRKNMTDIVREAVVEYLERHLPKESLQKVKEMLETEPEFKSKKGGK